MNNHVFGPVPSRRLGRSLGIDLVPSKTCTYDCIYCQLGRTTCKTIERKDWVPLEDVLVELKSKLHSKPDYITLSGSGEPTLFSRIGELIGRIKEMTDIPVAVLTNGSLLWQEEVRTELLNADLIIPSLDAGDEAMFHAVNRPHEGISFDAMLHGLVEFRRRFQRQYWLEVFLLKGRTMTDAALAKLIRCVELISPDRVQMNTVTRPPAENFAVGISHERLGELAVMFNPPAEVIADYLNVHGRAEFTAGREEILSMLRRRSCAIDDIANGLGMHRNEVLKHVEELSLEKLVSSTWLKGRCYYRAADGG